MILSFKSRFVDKIKKGHKRGSVRQSGRWTPGDKIHFYEGNPRNGGTPFGTGMVRVVFPVTIDPIRDTYIHNFYPNPVEVTEREDLDEFAVSDGFDDWEDLKTFFPKVFKGEWVIWEDTFQPI